MLLKLFYFYPHSTALQMSFLSCRDSDKCALLLYLLKYVIKETEQTVVFAATKHHVEFLNMVSKIIPYLLIFSLIPFPQTVYKVYNPSAQTVYKVYNPSAQTVYKVYNPSAQTIYSNLYIRYTILQYRLYIRYTILQHRLYIRCRIL